LTLTLPRRLFPNSFGPMRLRIPELFKERDQTPYEVARDSGGRLTEATLYRIARERGAVKFVSLGVLQALCDVLQVEPAALFAYERQAVRRPAAKRKSAR
jgi:DNA-binding Xre family transcriptional regulator